MKKIILSFGAISLLASCSTTSHTYRANSISEKQVVAGQVVVDSKLDVKEKITAISSKRNSEREAMDEAYYKAIESNSIDVVVDPIFEVTTSDKILFWGGKSVAKLTGFGATYVNPRTKVEAIKELKSVDTLDIKKFDAIYNSSSVKKSNTSTATKRSGFWAIFFK